VYTGSWLKEFAGRAWSGTSGNTGSGTAALSATAGDHADYTFTGTAVTWLSFRSPLAGIAEVVLDGASQGQFDLYAAAESVRVPIFARSGLSAGRHTLRINVTGARNPSATNGYVTVDAFDVAWLPSAPTITRVQETDPAITYTTSPPWTRGNSLAFMSGDFATGSYRIDPAGQAVVTAGAMASFTFTGTGVRWIGYRGFATGVARVRLDSVLVATIETRVTTQEEYQAVVYQVSGLPAATHTIEIEVVGRNNEPPGTRVEHPVWLDAFDVD
jgi:hypothetical protein